MRISDWSSDVCSSDLLSLFRKSPVTGSIALESGRRHCAKTNLCSQYLQSFMIHPFQVSRIWKARLPALGAGTVLTRCALPHSMGGGRTSEIGRGACMEGVGQDV